MKIVFAGPSLYGAKLDWGDVRLAPPASQGDLFRAVTEGATAIGLIDGYFGATASVWHKEILFALRRGVHVVGGASMGALRAAECAAFGMEPVGRIAADYLSGVIDDDSLVAISHGPAEVGFAPVTDALVDTLATIDRLAQDQSSRRPKPPASPPRRATPSFRSATGTRCCAAPASRSGTTCGEAIASGSSA